jgi:flagellar basal-body rod protein FlgB
MSNLFVGIEPLHSALDYHLDRHNVLASNIAHVDTPGYVPRDLSRVADTSFAQTLSVTMQRTDPSHFGGTSPAEVTTGRVFDDPSPGAGNDKNFVSLDREAAKIAANQLRYDVSSTLAAAELAQLAYVAGDARGA